MTAYFVDSSAAIKLYVSESGSIWIRNLVQPSSDEIQLAQVTLVEVTSALFRRAGVGTFSLADAQLGASDLLRRAGSDFDVLLLEQPVFDRALDVAAQHALRAYDCVQLATALVARDWRVSAGLSPHVFVSADADLNAAAALEGLAVEDPNLH